MHIPKGRLRTFAALGTLTTLAFSSVQAGQFGGSENQLVGITLRTSTFRDVLSKFGQPDEIQGGGPFLPIAPKSAVAAVTGGNNGPAFGRGGGKGGMAPEGGMPGSGGGPSSGGRSGGAGGGSGKRTTSKFGFPGESDGDTGGGGGAPGSGGGARGGYPGAPGSGGYPGAPGSGGYPGAPGSGGYPGEGGKGGGLPGFPGGNTGGGPGGYPGPGGSSIPGSGETGDSADTEAPVTEATWWYHNPRKGYHMSFLFNKKGQVIQIQEYGSQTLHNGHTRQGIALGSNMTQVLSKYGWSNDGAHSGDNVTMRYGGANKVAFQMVHNRVLGITVAVGK